MSDAGDRLAQAMQRHQASVAASRETAQQIADERDAEAGAATDAVDSPSPSVVAPSATEGGEQ